MIEIREARPQDSRPLTHIGIRSWEAAVVSWGEDIDRIRENAHAAYRDFTSNYWDRILLAHSRGTIMGWGARENLDHQISDLWIDPEYHRKGAGAVLLAAMEQSVQSAGYDRVELETHARNANAIAFYKHLGYRVTSFSVKYSTSLQQDIEKVTMCKEFSGTADG
ncbi:GNAT family N-acetyltransferase [Hoeflea prorocentri]|uniref:GNAT family N-acetyltransferase n=1 Tax=Hoeflea prorocentri TaxID=1922333 RepID=A0A9X3ZHC9_9HYPH|nr:GNAT family N-acetyltransferase [Hoeflea prorocentri]MCY6380640.1 GNAT family N-acetyltransferase [Hoeflea prorocentri]MDA5398440.1 GNAT family N-acetyltransferase [Hoeflea prorocentri]